MAIFDSSNAPLAGGYFDSEDVPAPIPRVECVPPSQTKAVAQGKFNPDIRNQIIEAIQNGVYPHIAAQSVGVGSVMFRNWLVDTRPEYIDFQHEVNQALAVARASCERLLKISKPETWLTRGPGRDKGNPNEPGWLDSSMRIEGTMKHAHAHLHAGVQPVDLSKLPFNDLKQLENLLAQTVGTVELKQLDVADDSAPNS